MFERAEMISENKCFGSGWNKKGHRWLWATCQVEQCDKFVNDIVALLQNPWPMGSVEQRWRSAWMGDGGGGVHEIEVEEWRVVAGKIASVDGAHSGSGMEKKRGRGIESNGENKNARGHRSRWANGCIIGKIANDVWTVGVRREPRTEGMWEEAF